MNAKEANVIFEGLKQLPDHSDSEKVAERVKQLQESGIELNVVAEDDDPEFFNEACQVAETLNRSIANRPS